MEERPTERAKQPPTHPLYNRSRSGSVTGYPTDFCLVATQSFLPTDIPGGGFNGYHKKRAHPRCKNL